MQMRAPRPSDNFSHSGLPPLTRVNKIILIVLGAFFLLDSIMVRFSGQTLRAVTGLSASSFFDGHIYQLLTYPLVCNDLLGFLFTGLIFWFLGGEFEFLWGTRRYIKFLLTVLIVGGLFFLLISLPFSGPIQYFPLSGASGATGALCVAFGYLFPERVMYIIFFPVKAKYFAMILIGILLYQGFFYPAFAPVWGQVGSCACAFWWVGQSRIRSFCSKYFKSRRKFSIIDKDKDKDKNIYH